MRIFLTIFLFLCFSAICSGYIPPLDISKLISDSEEICIAVVQDSKTIEESALFLVVKNVVIPQTVLKGRLTLNKNIEVYTEEFNPKALNKLPYDHPLRFPPKGTKILLFLKASKEGALQNKFILADNQDGLWIINKNKFEDFSRPSLDKLKALIEKTSIQK